MKVILVEKEKKTEKEELITKLLYLESSRIKFLNVLKNSIVRILDISREKDKFTQRLLKMFLQKY